MPQILYPTCNLAFPTQRSELARISVLAKGRGYLVEDDEVVQLGSEEDAVTCEAFLRPPSAATERLLILFLGGIGDVICIRSCLDKPALLETFPDLKEIGFVSFMEDRLILGDSIQGVPVTVYDYPISEELIPAYDGVVSYGILRRQSLHQSLWTTYATPLGLPVPTTPTPLRPNPNLVRSMRQFKGSARWHVGIQATSPSIYKSWHIPQAYRVALELQAMGCNVYFLGGPGQRLEITEDGVADEPHPGIIDMGGLLRNVGEIIAFCASLDAFVTVDSGVMHIAGCLGKPTVALFSLTDAASRAGLYPSVVTIEAQKSCSPCWSVVDYPDCGEPYCTALAAIPTDRIVSTVADLLPQRC